MSRNRRLSCPDNEMQGNAHQYLAAGFRDVDSSGDPLIYRQCLDLIAKNPFFSEIKQESIRIISRAGPARVLDAGCGAGADLAALAKALPQSSAVTGLDASASLLGWAAERSVGCRDRCSLVRGDLLHSPFRDRAFDACRTDRVLQHIHEPGRAVLELARIIAPGGILVAFDNDWDTFSISLDDPHIADRIARFWRDSFAAGTVGRDLPALLKDCGFLNIRSEPRTLRLSDMPVAEKVFDLASLLLRMVQTGALSKGERTGIVEELSRRDEAGTFSLGYTGYLVRARKPASVR